MEINLSQRDDDGSDEVSRHETPVTQEIKMISHEDVDVDVPTLSIKEVAN